jgi:hypothetical protein
MRYRGRLPPTDAFNLSVGLSGGGRAPHTLEHFAAEPRKVSMTSRNAALAILLAYAWGAVFAAAPLPSGWRLEGDALVWTSDTPLRMGGARYEIRTRGRLLGYAMQRGDTLRLRVPPGAPLDELSVWSGGRRLDGVAAQRHIREQSVAPDVEPGISAWTFDPAVRGPYETRRLKYELPGLVLPDYPAPIEVLAEVTTPLGRAGPMPLVLLLHGRHSTCYRSGADGELSGDWPCPSGWRPVPSLAGYRYITDVLASQGYLAVSIAANGVNGQDGLVEDGGSSARSALVRHHLAQWAEWSGHGGDPWGGRFRGRVDLDDVVLVGHSRGGEGVERATLDSHGDDPWRVRGLVLIGPTAFGRQVAPGVHTAVILPFCDGDVSDLQGQQYVDVGRDLSQDRALRASIMAMGTNHNYYNTEWTPGLARAPSWDDWFDARDPQCGEQRDRRLGPAEQQAVGLAYTAALVNLALAEDVRSLPLLDGSRVKPPSIGRASAFVHAIGGNKRVVYAAGRGTQVIARALSARECRGYYVAGPFDIRTGCTPDLYFELIPHWSPMAFVETAPAPRALEVAWSGAGGSVRIPVAPARNGGDALDFRIVGEPGAGEVDIDVRVRDSSGAWTTLGSRPMTLRSYHGPAPLGKAVARQLRMPLRGLDAGRMTEIELIPRTPTGKFWLLDISTKESSLAPMRASELPRVSVGRFRVPEGDSGETAIEIPLSIEGEVATRARLWVQLTNFASFDDPVEGFPLVLEPGATTASIPFTYRGDSVYDPFTQVTQVTLLARRNAVTGVFAGTVEVVEDDPAPRLSIDVAQVTATEGASLTWTFRLSEPLANWAYWPVQIVAAGARFAELDTDDVEPAFLEQFGIGPPRPAVPLSELGLSLGLEFEPGVTARSVAIPVRADGTAEPLEGVSLRVDGFGDPVVPQPIGATGIVPAG